MNEQIKILVISPAFNEEGSIVKVVADIKAALPQADVLVINDKSVDHTEKELLDHHIDYISLPVNLGIGGAVQTGFLYARQEEYDLVVLVDGDGQHPAEQIGSLIKPLLEKDYDFVVGSRYFGKVHVVSSFYRALGGYVLSWLIYLLTGKQIKDPTSGFRAFNKRTIAFLAVNYPQDYPEPISAFELMNHHFRYEEISVTMQPRKHGRSSIVGLAVFFYMIKVMFTILIIKIRKK